MRNFFELFRRNWAARRVKARQKIWDQEYASGLGRRLSETPELEHHRKLADFLVAFGKNKKILDVGCGEGLLLDFLPSYLSYLGIDFSGVALQAASRRANTNTIFVEAVAETYATADVFDAIVFNESLYYLPEPLKILERYEMFLDRDGLVFVSMFTRTEAVRELGEGLVKRYEVVRRAKVENERGIWECFVLRRLRGGRKG